MGQLLEDENPAFEDIMRCVFSIQAREVRTYLALVDRPGSTVEELATALDRDRSNINRSLAELIELDLATRERRLLDPGGYVYQYTAAELPDTKARLHEALDRWVHQVHTRIDEFGENQ